MHTPAAFAVDEPADVLAALRRTAFGHLVTNGPAPRKEDDGAPTPVLTATALPFIVDQELTTVRAHFARANAHWRSIDGIAALLIVPGVDAYVSPRWYPSKTEHGKVVPTWNYELIHINGLIEIHDDAEWKLELVSDLTELHEQRAEDADAEPPWMVTDAPADFIAGQLRAIVGVQLNVTGIEAKAKLSQNRVEADRLGAIAGLARSSDPRDRSMASTMDRAAAGRAAEG